MALPLRVRALNYLKSRKGRWINGGELEREAIKAGYKGSTVSRELRLLAENGEIERKLTNGRGVKSVEYRYPSGLTERQQILKDNAESIKFFDSYPCQCSAPNKCTKHV